MDKKKILGLLSCFIVIILLIICMFYYHYKKEEITIKNSYTSYMNLINNTHDYSRGSKGLDSLNNEKGQSLIKTLKEDLQVASSLKEINDEINSNAMDNIESNLKNTESLSGASRFSLGIKWLKEDIEEYSKVIEEIKALDSTASDYNDKLKEVIANHKFNNEKIKSNLKSGNQIKDLEMSEKIPSDILEGSPTFEQFRKDKEWEEKYNIILNILGKQDSNVTNNEILKVIKNNPTLFVKEEKVLQDDSTHTEKAQQDTVQNNISNNTNTNINSNANVNPVRRQNNSNNIVRNNNNNVNNNTNTNSNTTNADGNSNINKNRNVNTNGGA